MRPERAGACALVIRDAPAINAGLPVSYPRHGGEPYVFSVPPGAEHMDKNRIEGKARQVKGAIRDPAASGLGKPGLKAEGKIEKVVGRVQEGVGKARDEVAVNRSRRRSKPTNTRRASA